MEKYIRYKGVVLFCVAALMLLVGTIEIIKPKVAEWQGVQSDVQTKQKEENDLQEKVKIVDRKLKAIKDSNINSQKKVYSPIESDLGKETLFFTLYNDVVEMLHANSVKVKSIDYKYNPQNDSFVSGGGDLYFVCDVNMELVSNYVNLGKLIQDIYQYPYYIRINELEVKAYPRDKKVLITKLSLRLYARTTVEESAEDSADASVLEGAETGLPQ